MDDKYIANNILNAQRIGKQWYPHDLYTELRARPTLTWLEPEGFDPFWAIVKHADIKEISTQPDKFLNGPRTIVSSRADDKLQSAAPRMLINMDPPEHRSYRKFVNAWFVPRNIKKLEDRMRRSAKDLVDMMASSGTWSGDFVFDIAAIHPVRLITHLFDLPDSEEGRLIEIANQTFGTDDPEFQTGERTDANLLKLLMQTMKYFNDLLVARKKNPGEDLASAIATAEIDGKPIGQMEAIGYYFIILTAGHETTRTAMAGGMHQLLQNPAELRKLKENPDLVEFAVEEMIRWTSPVSQFGRTAVEDYELRGKTIKAGQSVCLFYGAANRDEEIWEDPFAFRVDRDPNPHLGFGIGEHFCLGASLARLEMNVFFEEFIKRVDVDSIEQTGDVEYSSTFFVGGVKHLPMQCRIVKKAA
ncbi:MAG: cytochrome P450 [Chrysiogenetes bacterium]|nr:cytochrome P450 [Chrysiogenetes bacterium]